MYCFFRTCLRIPLDILTFQDRDFNESLLEMLEKFLKRTLRS
jgi:hypothetical protein